MSKSILITIGSETLHIPAVANVSAHDLLFSLTQATRVGVRSNYGRPDELTVHADQDIIVKLTTTELPEGTVKSLSHATRITELQEESARYSKYWSDERSKTKKLEEQVKELGAKLDAVTSVVSPPPAEDAE